MYPGSLPYGIPVLIISVLTGGLAFYAFRRIKLNSMQAFGWLMCSITIWSLFYALELLAPTYSIKLLASKIKYLGIATVSPLWLVLALIYTGRSGWLTLPGKLLMATPSLITIILAQTNELHHLIWTDVRLDPLGFPSLVVKHGTWFWIHTVISYVLIMTGIILYLIAYLRTTRLYRRQIGVMVIGSLVPVAGNIIYLTKALPIEGLDLTPFGFAISGLLLMWGLFQFNLLDLMPIAASVVVENLRDAVIVVDTSRRIVDMNPVAHQWLGQGEDAIGKNAADVLTPLDIVQQFWDVQETQIQLEFGEGEQHRWYDTTISPLRNAQGEILGRVIVARDNTREHALLIIEKKRARMMELLNEITRASIETNDFQQTIQILADRLGELLEADGAFITLWDEADNRTIPAAAYGEFRESYPNMQLDQDENTLTASIFRERRPLPIEDVFNTPYMNPNLASDVPARSVLALPLIANNRKIGAALISFNKRHKFSTEDIANGEQAAQQIALMIYKATLLEAEHRRAAQLNLLEEVGRQIANSLEESEILESTINAVVNKFGYAEVAISLLVKHDTLEIAAINGTEDFGYQSGYQQKMGEGIIGYVAQTRQAYVSGDVSKDPYHYSTAERHGSALGVPILKRDELFGVIYLETTTRNEFKPDDVRTLQTLANQVAISLQKARLHAQTQEHLQVMTTLQSVSQAVAASLELKEILHNVIKLLKDTFGYTYISVYLLEDEILRLGAQLGYPDDLVIHEIPITSGITGQAVRTKQTQFVPDVTRDSSFLRASYEVQSEICVPFIKNHTVLGILNVESDSRVPLDENDVTLLNTLAGTVAVAIDNARLYAQVKDMAMTDAVSGLYNRHAFEEFLATEIQRANRYGHFLSLIIFDVDSFKQYNDTWGHPAGDSRLKAIADLIRSSQRKPDIAARYGGDEFAIILPNTNAEGAEQFARRLLEAARASTSEESTDGHSVSGYTLSVGFATYPKDGATLASILQAADQAELMAKRLGKNRVVSANKIIDL